MKKSLFRFGLLSLVMSSLAVPALAQTPAAPGGTRPTAYPFVTFGIDSFLQYSAELHEQDGYNAFDVTRGYLNIKAQMSDKVSFRFTPDVRPTTDANLDRNLALRLEYAALDVQVSDNVKVMFGQHETPWLTFEESVNRYRVIGPFFSERLGLIPGPTDLGASIKATHGRTEVHAGVYNGEGYGQAELDRYKAIDGRATFRPFDPETELGKVTISGFYQYGWYARDRPRNVAIVMGSYASGMTLAESLERAVGRRARILPIFDANERQIFRQFERSQSEGHLNQCATARPAAKARPAGAAIRTPERPPSVRIRSSPRFCGTFVSELRIQRDTSA